MAASFKHTFNCGLSDGGDATVVRPSNWNAEHTVTVAAPGTGNRTVLGADSAETAVVEKALYDTTVPVGPGAAAVGTALTAARRDHVHPIYVCREFGAPDFDDPNNSDWPIAVPAELTVDSINAGLPVRRFDATAEEGVGFDFYLPTGATSLKFIMFWRVQTTPGGTVGIQPSLRVREVYGAATPESWAETDMTALSATVAQATNWQRSEQTITLSTLSLVAERSAHFELTRQPADADDTLTTDWVLLKLIVEIT